MFSIDLGDGKHLCMVCGSPNDEPVVPIIEDDGKLSNWLLTCEYCEGCSPPGFSNVHPEGREYLDGKVRDGANTIAIPAVHVGEVLDLLS